MFGEGFWAWSQQQGGTEAAEASLQPGCGFEARVERYHQQKTGSVVPRHAVVSPNLGRLRARARRHVFKRNTAFKTSRSFTAAHQHEGCSPMRDNLGSAEPPMKAW
ncbi:hypothetical protein AAFF_G00199430 [Aldrovandia affinis]|uniref:Uncharacterized protein n=1 Tax=Aldrovandia affinis TaxID=143900 RepID=A0AAD7RIJ2_9TELE|nr:hypothetical protein AAFF_G00199430 [Aldrovandia affinis]